MAKEQHIKAHAYYMEAKQFVIDNEQENFDQPETTEEEMQRFNYDPISLKVAMRK